MAVLSDPDRADVRHDICTTLSRESVSVALTKAEWHAAVNAVDQWVEDNKGSYNTALPEPAKSVLTNGLKARLLTSVVEKRFETGV